MGMNIHVFTNVSKIERNDGEGKHELEVLNILHINFNDTNDETRVEIICMEEGQSADDHKEFTNDETGNAYRYKVLVKNMSIHKVLYNDGQSVSEVQFVEIKMRVSDKMIVTKHRLS